MDTVADMPGSPPAGGASRPTRTKNVVTPASVPGFLICALRPTATTLPWNCLSAIASIVTVASLPT
jgi:hypothetical protein